MVTLYGVDFTSQPQYIEQVKLSDLNALLKRQTFEPYATYAKKI